MNAQPRPRIIVVRGDKLSSRAIEGFGGGWPSHMGNLLADGSVWDARDDHVLINGALFPPGVQHRPVGYLQAQFNKWAIFEAPAGAEKVYEAWTRTLASQGGKPYDQAGIWSFAKGVFSGKYIDRNYAPADPGKNKAWFCDEYAVWAAGVNGLIPWPQSIPIYTLTPGSALNLFIGAGWELVGAKWQ